MAGRPQRRAQQRAFGMGALPQGQLSGSSFLPSPVGGINTVSPAGVMPASDCLGLTNLIAFQYGLRVRSGFYDWFTGIRFADIDGTIKFDPVKNLLSFTGSSSSGENDRLFAVTQRGIYDVSEQQTVLGTFTQTPVFGAAQGWRSTAAAGVGPCQVVSNAGGEHFLLYTDGENGYLQYRESTGTWIKITQGSGTDGLTIAGANPETFCYVTYWKSRVWFVKRDSATAYYLDARNVTGQAYAANFSPRFQYGGDLVGLWGLTLDGGQGIDDLLVAVSRAGDVAVYQGTDPSLPGAFGLRGVYWMGPVPPGRSIASTFGGDLFVLSRAGCLPISKLINGGLIRDPNTYETAKITNLFNRLMSTNAHLMGWSITQHPTDNLFMVNVPGLYGRESTQLAMSFGTKGWSQMEGLPIVGMTTWRGLLYFGTPDGRVCVNAGYHDSGVAPVLVAGSPNQWQYTDAGPQEIEFSMLSSYQTLGSPRKKLVHMARPYFITEGQQPAYKVEARFDYDLRNVPLADVPAVSPSTSGWGYGRWGVATWGENPSTAGKQMGTTGMGTAVALALTGTAIVNTTFVGMDVMIEQGGLL